MSTLTLLDENMFDAIPEDDVDMQVKLGQWMTRDVWARELLEQFFGDLTDNDVVLDPTCGTGAWLRATPANVHGLGVELDPKLATIARRTTGRTIIVGDITSDDTIAELKKHPRPTAIVGNPPFRNDLIETVLNQMHPLLKNNGRTGFIIPALLFGCSRRVMRINSNWSVAQYLLPRYIYPRLREALAFAIFTKDQQQRLIGFALFREFEAIKDIPEQLRAKLMQSKANPWRDVVAAALALHGGRATSKQLLKTIAPFAPSSNRYVPDKIRQIGNLHFPSDDVGVYELPTAA